MNVIETSGMNREQWLELRVDRQGASDSVSIVGLNKHRSRFRTWLEKTRQAEPEEAGEEARWGLRLEDDILEEVCMLGFKPAAIQVMIEHPNYPWMSATLDMVDTDEEIHEFKAVGFQNGRSLEDGNPASLPDGWLIQTAHQMACGNKERAFVHVFAGGRLKMLNFEVLRDDSIIDGVLQLNAEFRLHVINRTPPAEFDAQDAALLLKHYRDVEDDIIVTEDDRLLAMSRQYEAAKAAADFQSELADQLKAHLLARMTTASAMRCGPYLMKRSKVDVRAQEPKPRAAYSYTKFSFSNTESDE